MSPSPAKIRWSNKRWMQILTGLFSVWLSGCSQFIPQPTVTEPLTPVVNLTDVPFFPQQPFHCGPAALATVANHQGVVVTPDDLAPQLWTPSVKGTFALDMLSATRRQQLVPYPTPTEFTELLALTEAGYPSLHLLNLGLNWAPQWHYAVLVGYDLEREEVLLRSGTIKERRMRWTHFEAARRKADYWGIVPVPANTPPPIPNATEAYQALSDYGQIQPDDALAAWQAASAKWPQDWRFYFGLGNQQYGSNPTQANQSYLSAIGVEPKQAEVWNNLAYGLMAQQCPAQAQQALSCAGTLDPDSAEIQHSVTELTPLFSTTRSSGQTCLVLPACPTP